MLCSEENNNFIFIYFILKTLRNSNGFIKNTGPIVFCVQTICAHPHSIYTVANGDELNFATLSNCFIYTLLSLFGTIKSIKTEH